MATLSSSCVDWGEASRSLPGQAESGDKSIVLETAQGTLLAAVDGVGHGDEAAIASRLALRVLDRHASENVISQVRRLHEALRPTRGVVLSLAAINVREGILTWLGVGNVEGVLLRADAPLSQERLILRGGVVGGQLPPLQASVVPLNPGDLLILATDGIRSNFDSGLIRSDSPKRIADRILQQYGKDTDDALVLAVRYLGARE